VETFGALVRTAEKAKNGEKAHRRNNAETDQTALVEEMRGRQSDMK
jgi:hypothetical protein